MENAHPEAQLGHLDTDAMSENHATEENSQTHPKRDVEAQDGAVISPKQGAKKLWMTTKELKKHNRQVNARKRAMERIEEARESGERRIREARDSEERRIERFVEPMERGKKEALDAALQYGDFVAEYYDNTLDHALYAILDTIPDAATLGVGPFIPFDSSWTGYQNLNFEERVALSKMVTVMSPIITTALAGRAGHEFLVSLAESPRVFDVFVSNATRLKPILLLAIAQAAVTIEDVHDADNEPKQNADIVGEERSREDVDGAGEEQDETKDPGVESEEAAALVLRNNLRALYCVCAGQFPLATDLEPYRKVLEINKSLLQQWEDAVTTADERAGKTLTDPTASAAARTLRRPISDFFVNFSDKGYETFELSAYDEALASRLRTSNMGSAELVKAVRYNPRLLQHIKTNFALFERGLHHCVESAAFVMEQHMVPQSLAAPVLADAKEVFKFCAGHEYGEDE